MMQGQRFATLFGASALVLMLWSARTMAADRFTVTDLGTLGGLSSVGYAINDRGQVTGTSWIADDAEYHAFLYSDGVMIDLGTLGGTLSEGQAINNRGQVTGHAFLPGVPVGHAFLYSDGVTTDLGTLGGSLSVGHAINNRGQVTGESRIPGDAEWHAFLYSDGVMTDIHPAGWLQSSRAFGINDQGQIVGWGTNPDGHIHAFRLDPIRDQTPPKITIAATPETLWPPNGKLIPVTIVATITDAGSGVDPSTTAYAVEDEYGSVEPSGSLTLGQDGRYTATIGLQASRNATDANGRQYIITVSAQDNEGNTGSVATGVTVPHDQGQGGSIAAR